MHIELAYALNNEQTLLSLEVKSGTDVKSAILQSNILKKYPQIDLNKNKVGIFSKVVSLDTKLRDRDRIEIYRPLIADAKAIRKKRAAADKIMHKK